MADAFSLVVLDVELLHLERAGDAARGVHLDQRVVRIVPHDRQNVSQPDDSQALEVGAGAPGLTRRLQRRLDGGRILGVDQVDEAQPGELIRGAPRHEACRRVGRQDPAAGGLDEDQPVRGAAEEDLEKIAPVEVVKGK